MQPTIDDIQAKFPFYNIINDTRPAKNLSLPEFIQKVENPRIGAKETAPVIVPYNAQGKTKEHALKASYYAVVVDHDHGNMTAEGIQEIYDPYNMAYLAFTTSSHQLPGKGNRWKVLIPLSCPVNHGAWLEIAMGAALKMNADESQARTCQVFYAPNILDENAVYESIIKTDLPFLDLSDTQHPFVSDCYNAYTQNEARKDQIAVNAKPMPRPTLNGNGSIIEQVNQAFSLSDVLMNHGYQSKGGKYLSPTSESLSPGVKILDDSRCYSHHGTADPLSNLNNAGHSLDCFDVLCLLDHGGDVSQAVKKLSTQVDPEGQKERQREYMKEQDQAGLEQKPPEEKTTRRKITYLSGADIISKPMKIEWLIVGMLSMNESILIHASGGVGKSMFVLYLILVLGAFKNSLEDSLNGFLGDSIIPKRRASLVIGSENGRVATYQRLKLMCGGPGNLEDGLKNIFFLSQYEDTTITGEVFLDDSFCDFLVGYLAVIEKEQNLKIDIIVIDPLISFTGADDENNSAVMRPALDAIDKVCKQVKCTPIVIHHDKKDGDNYRGSTAINDWTRNRISLRREFIAENRITDQDTQGTVTGQRVAQIPVIRVRHEKCNNFKMFDPFLIRMNQHLHFERVNEQMSPEDAEKSNAVAQALKDMGDYSKSTNALSKVYQDLAGLGGTAAKNHIKIASENGLIKRESVIADGKQTYEYHSV